MEKFWTTCYLRMEWANEDEAGPAADELDEFLKQGRAAMEWRHRADRLTDAEIWMEMETSYPEVARMLAPVKALDLEGVQLDLELKRFMEFGEGQKETEVLDYAVNVTLLHCDPSSDLKYVCDYARERWGGQIGWVRREDLDLDPFAQISLT